MKKLVMNMSERTDRMKFDDKEFQILTVKNVPPFVSKLFFEDIFNYPDVRASIGIQECITSPTFTIVQEYEDGRVPFYHFDVYRISDSYEMYEIGFEEYINGDGICLIEWASLIEDILPEDIIKVNISKDLDKGIDYRVITVDGME